MDEDARLERIKIEYDQQVLCPTCLFCPRDHVTLKTRQTFNDVSMSGETFKFIAHLKTIDHRLQNRCSVV